MALEIRKVNKSVLPKSNQPGRTRQPSDFDDYIEDAYADTQINAETSWREVPYDGTEESLTRLLADLGRAVIFVGEGKGKDGKGYGKSLRGVPNWEEDDAATLNEDGEPVFYFQIGDKKNTGRRGPRGPRKTVVVDGETVDIDSDDEGDDTGEASLAEIEQSVESAKSDSGTTKRGRKNTPKFGSMDAVGV